MWIPFAIGKNLKVVGDRTQIFMMVMICYDLI